MADSIEYNFPEAYEIIKKIGRGGTADIFLARRHGNSRPVVLKRFYDPSSRGLVAREQLIADRIHFPGLVRVHDSERTADDNMFLRMEYCPGPTLEKFIGRISEQKLLTTLSALAASLYVLHTNGFVHNDLKPSNIFCPEGFDSDDFPTERLFYLKLADFSLAEEYRLEENKIVTGTIGYMSPEMILKKEIRPTSDLFSLGVMAYQLACGTMPFASAGNDPLEINAQITEGRRPELTGPGQALSKGLSDLILSLLSIDSARRPSSAFVLMETLSKLGSPYPYRVAVRPRHLLPRHQAVDAHRLSEIFGRDSFSPAQLKFIERVTGYQPQQVRILLEDNFDRDNFARIDGRWGWKTEQASVIEWGRRQIHFSLRPLSGLSPVAKKLALALAVADDLDLAEKLAGLFGEEESNCHEQWLAIPEECRPGLLHSLNQIMRPSSRKAVSARMAGTFREDDKYQALTGRLLFYAGKYEDAVRLLDISTEHNGADQDGMMGLIELMFQAAEKADDLPLQATALLKKARLEKDMGRLTESEKTYLGITGMLENRGQDKLLAQACKELGNLYKAKTDYQSGIRILGRALEIYTGLNDQLGLSHTFNSLGNMHWIAGNLDQALEQYQKALVIQRELKSDLEIATSLNNIGVMYVVKGDYEKGIEHYRQSLEIRQRLGDKGQIAQTWNNLGATYFLMGDAVRALEPFRQALDINREIGTQVDLLFNIENLAEAMIQAGRLSQALEYLKEGRVQAEKLGEASHQSTVNRLTGQLLRRMGYYDEAEDKLNLALELSQKIDNRGLMLLCQIDLARLYIQLRENEAARRAIDRAAQIAGEVGDKSALSHISLLRVAMTGRQMLIAGTGELEEDLDTQRERAVLHLMLLEANNRQGLTGGSEKYREAAAGFFSQYEEDVDLARYYLAVGGHQLLQNDLAKAEEHFKQAMELSRKLNLLPEQWQATCAMSELKFSEKDFESSFKYARQTTDILKKIASHIKDSNRLGQFYNDQRIIELLGRIKSLQAVLGKMKGAAVGSP